MPTRLDTPLGRELARQGRLSEWLARQLGVSKWTASRIEAGRQRAPDGYYERAAEILGVDVAVIRPAAAEEVAA